MFMRASDPIGIGSFSPQIQPGFVLHSFIAACCCFKLCPPVIGSSVLKITLSSLSLPQRDSTLLTRACSPQVLSRYSGFLDNW